MLLAGGKGSRLGGVDKPALLLDGRTLLDRALEAVAGAEPVVVVGPERPTARPVRWTREEPPGAGPLAALAAGLDALGPVPGAVALLAADLAAVTPGTVQRLCGTLAVQPHADGALLVDEGGAEQWLLGVWRADALRRAVHGVEPGGSLRSVLGPLDAVRVPERAGESADIDTESDLRAAGGSGPSTQTGP